MLEIKQIKQALRGLRLSQHEMNLPRFFKRETLICQKDWNQTPMQHFAEMWNVFSSCCARVAITGTEAGVRRHRTRFVSFSYISSSQLKENIIQIPHLGAGNGKPTYCSFTVKWFVHEVINSGAWIEIIQNSRILFRRIQNNHVKIKVYEQREKKKKKNFNANLDTQWEREMWQSSLSETLSIPLQICCRSTWK